MVHFVVPFKSKQVSKNWELDSRYCLRTIKGLLKQTSDAYTVTLACHQRPNGFERVASHPKVRLVERPDFWVPADPSHTPGLLADKDRKLRAAMASLKKYDRGYMMPVDADDAIHAQLAEYIMNVQSNANLYYADQGYVYDQLTGFLFLKQSIHRLMGSSLVVRWSQEDLPKDENDESRPDILTNDKGNINHSDVVDSAREDDQYTTEAIPFPSVCYLVGTGVNVVGAGYAKSSTVPQKIKSFFKAVTRFWQLRYPSKQWRGDFGFT